MRLSTLEVLSEAEVNQIHNATLDILGGCGVEVHNAKMLAFLKDKGLDVDEEKKIVRFTRGCVEDALSSIPSRFEVFDREGEPAYILGDGNPKVAAGHNAVFWVDSETGKTRPSRVEDVARFARICEKLDCIDMIGIPVMPQDVPNPKATLLHGVAATVKNSRKPIYFSTDSYAVNRSIIDILAAAFKGDLSNQVYGISQLSPTAPLYWEGSVIDAIMNTVETGAAISILPEPNAGVSCPYTLAGLITVNNAECLSGLVMIQLLNPGAKVMYANSWTTTDMRTGDALVGSTETTICRVAAAQLARLYKTPSHTTAPNSDNHAHDEQNSWEKTFSMFCATAARHDLIVNCGMFATGMTCSDEQLIMDEEISAMSRRIGEGLRVDDETIAADVIREVGPRGSYLMHDHTLQWIREPKEYLPPRVSVRGAKASWDAAGAKDTYALARKKAIQLNTEGGCPIEANRAVNIDEIIASFS
ncbi:MAG: trimethylamine methyltransferase family protein [Phycisphaerae bacterium]|nr:trimethylamine methyltransferase family protein [Phycisphaerae bacterium]